jgi:hypothetical protein
LKWRDDGAGVVVSELLDDVGFPQSLLDIAILGERCGEVSPARSAEVWRSRRHHLRKARSERKDLVVDLKGFDGVLGNVFRFRGNDGHEVTLEEKFFGQGICFGGILACENVGDAGNLQCRCGIQFSNPCAWMGAPDELRT